VPCLRALLLPTVKSSPVGWESERCPMTTTTALSAGLDGPAQYLTWGPIQISVANLVTIGVIVVLFVLAVVLPFPKPRARR
jgi:hypothetical protein